MPEAVQFVIALERKVFDAKREILIAMKLLTHLVLLTFDPVWAEAPAYQQTLWYITAGRKACSSCRLPNSNSGIGPGAMLQCARFKAAPICSHNNFRYSQTVIALPN